MHESRRFRGRLHIWYKNIDPPYRCHPERKDRDEEAPFFNRSLYILPSNLYFNIDAVLPHKDQYITNVICRQEETCRACPEFALGFWPKNV